MEKKKNIHLFYGDNYQELKQKIRIWKEKFTEKHGDMNLQEYHKEQISESTRADMQAMGFMGSTRMMIFYDLLTTMADADDDSAEDEKENKDKLWIRGIEEAPDTNFIIFVGGKKPNSDIEKWLHENATLHHFVQESPRKMHEFVMSELGLSLNQAMSFCERLGFIEEYKFGKNIVIGKPDFIYREVEKLKLAGKKTWTNEELKKILPDYREENVFDLMNPLWERNAGGTHTLFQNLMATADHELTMATIITMLRKILVAATFQKIDGLPITDGQKKTGRSLSGLQKELKKMYDEIVSVDKAEKSGELPGKKEAFLMALLNFCR